MSVAMLCSGPRQAQHSLKPIASIISRNVHDLVIKEKTGRPLIRSGPQGRHAQTGHVATVFGATGFLGRYVVQKLARKGTQVIVPYREAEEARHLKPMGDLGQIVHMELDLRNDVQVEEAVRQSDTVYNLIGRDYETKNFKFHNVNVEGARRIARISSLVGVSRLIHVSHLAASTSSSSSFLRSKAEGEIAVREAFPDVTMVRPGPMWGHEDRLLRSVVEEVKRWRYNNGETLIRPVASTDVAEALVRMMDAESTIGRLFSLVGPQTFTHSELVNLVEQVTFRKLKGKPANKYISMAVAAALDKAVWWPVFGSDRIKRQFISDPEPDVNSLGFDHLGIEPDRLDETAVNYLRWKRAAPYADTPVERGGLSASAFKPKRYQTIA